jgi:glutathione S-transferase
LLNHQAIFSLAAPAIANSLNPVSHDYWRRTREIRVNSRLEDFSPLGAERENKFQSLQGDLSRVAVAIQKNGGDARYVMGDQPSFADFAIAAVLMWANRMLNAEEWDKIMSFDSGRWKRFLEDMDEYATVDAGEAYKSKA